MRRSAEFLLLILLSTGLLGAMSLDATAAQVKNGVATGRAVACSALMAEPLAHLSVYRGTVLVRRSSFPSGSTFRFTLPSGTYTISDQGHPGRYVGSQPFRVHPGKTTHVVIMNYCM
jgi:hypothetical protein